jgi:hypothetical protein
MNQAYSGMPAGGRHRHPGSPQLAVLATSSVIAGNRRLLRVPRFLASHAQSHTGNGNAAGFGNCQATFFAFMQAFTLRQLAAGALYRVFDGSVDLILNGSVPGKATGHDNLLNAIFAIKTL